VSEGEKRRVKNEDETDESHCVCVTAQWLRASAEELRQQDARLKASNDLFTRERLSLAADNEMLTMSIGRLQRSITDIHADTHSLKQQACTTLNQPINQSLATPWFPHGVTMLAYTCFDSV